MGDRVAGETENLAILIWKRYYERGRRTRTDDLDTGYRTIDCRLADGKALDRPEVGR